MTQYRKLNLGSGNRKREGWVNIDSDALSKPDIVRDLEKGLPFDDSTFDTVYASHVLEHIDDIIFLMREIHRICINKATVEIIVPHPNFPMLTFSDFTHKRVITPLAFQIFDKNYDKYAVQNSSDIIKGAYFKMTKCIDDYEGKINSQPQLYITLEVEK
jgi:predicted SAM-dependent methyltransferase